MINNEFDEELNHADFEIILIMNKTTSEREQEDRKKRGREFY